MMQRKSRVVSDIVQFFLSLSLSLASFATLCSTDYVFATRDIPIRMEVKASMMIFMTKSIPKSKYP